MFFSGATEQLARVHRGWVVGKEVSLGELGGELRHSALLGVKMNWRGAGDERSWVPAAQDPGERTICFVISGQLQVSFGPNALQPEVTQVIKAGEHFGWRNEAHATKALESTHTVTVRWREA